MKHLLPLLTLLLFSCTTISKESVYRKDFSTSETKIIKEAKKVITNANFVSLITLDKDKQPRARVMEFFAPDKKFEIWMGTNPKSRKVTQIKQNPKTTLHYFDPSQMAYVQKPNY